MESNDNILALHTTGSARYLWEKTSGILNFGKCKKVSVSIGQILDTW